MVSIGFLYDLSLSRQKDPSLKLGSNFLSNCKPTGRIIQSILFHDTIKFFALLLVVHNRGGSLTVLERVSDNKIS